MNKFMGVLATKVSGVFVRGVSAILPCRLGSFEYEPKDNDGDNTTYATWLNGDGEINRVQSVEVIGVRGKE